MVDFCFTEWSKIQFTAITCMLQLENVPASRTPLSRSRGRGGPEFGVSSPFRGIQDLRSPHAPQATLLVVAFFGG